MVKLRIQEVKYVQEILSLDVEVAEEIIYLRNLSMILCLRKEIIDLQLNSQEFQAFKEKEMKVEIENLELMTV
jgi:hypothetical protein